MYLSLAVLGFVGWMAYGNSVEKQEHMKKIAADYNLSETQVKAFKACDKQVSSLQLRPDDPNAKIINGSVPPSICACQAKQISEVMQPGKYSSHKNVIDYMTTDNNSSKRELDPSQINTNYTARQGFDLLLVSLGGCISKYRTERAAEIKELLKDKCSSGQLKGSRYCSS